MTSEIEVLKLQERLEIALELGESHYREFKSAQEGPTGHKIARDTKSVSEDIARTLVAFANGDGGELLVGVEDSGIVSGLTYSQDKLDVLLSAPVTHVHKDTPLPKYKARIAEISGKTILYFSIPKGNDFVYLTSDGRCIQRKDLESVPISAEEIIFSREEAVSREYDRQYIDTADMSDIDFELLAQIAGQLSIKVTPEKFLQHLDLAEFDGNRLKLKRGALLLFAKKPNKWHPRLQVRVIKVLGTELKNGEDFYTVNDEEVTDNIVNLIESSWEIIRPHLTETKFSKQALFKTQIVYPELACREALINAIAHRDYSIEGRGIEVYVFSDRLEIQSPGELLSSIKVSDLINQKGVHQSRNSNIAKALREIGYMRELGEGIRRIIELMRNNDLEAPSFESKNKSFKVTLSQKHIFTKEEKLWLDNFTQLNLSREQKTVVRLGTNGVLFSADDIWEACGIVDTDKYRQLLESLKKHGIFKRNFDRDKAWSIAKKTKTSKKEVKQFEIVLPQTFSANRDSMEVRRNVAQSIKKSTEPLDDLSYTKVFLSNVPYDTDEAEIKDFLSQFGDVVSVKIPRNNHTQKIRGFAYVEYGNHEDAKKIIEQSNQIKLKGRKLFIRQYYPKVLIKQSPEA